MFNKKLKQEVAEIKKVLDIVDNDFSSCLCCEGEPNKILKHNAKRFEILKRCPPSIDSHFVSIRNKVQNVGLAIMPMDVPFDGLDGNHRDYFIFDCYTTKKGYERHLPFIEEQQKKVKKFIKNNKKII